MPLLACSALASATAALLPGPSPTAASTRRATFDLRPSPTLSPAASPTPLGAGRLLVVESRRAEGCDHWLPEPGALVYVVDATLASGYGPLVVWSPVQEDAGLAQATLQCGEALSVAGYTIEVLASTARYDRVRLAPATPGAP